MKNARAVSWKEVVVGMVAGLFLVSAPTIGQSSEPSVGSTTRMDNRGPGSLNSGSGREGNSGRGSGDDIRVAQAGDVRQEDRREDRHLDRREDHREDRRLDRREDRREDRRANTGGELRGLDRADQVAGEHGHQGRDNARVVQMDRPNSQESVERPQRSEQPERPQRPERPERSGRH
jgi:hypothetical protein